ncbi:hypothetical protein N0V88_007468 [Collariella sp. IMI 366227]|nr:hypothetical protein N0V88_007468 [Collariella sp. IMI 366227]
MKVLFVGASGTIGGGVLDQCLAHPNITTVIAFVRRDLLPAVTGNIKLRCVIKKDFARWEDNELRAHADAAAVICPERPFRFLLLSGKFVTRNQDKTLWFLEKPRKLKGQLESKTMNLAQQHPSRWQAYVARPGGIISNGKIVGQDGLGAALGGLGSMLGKNWAIKLEELGAFMAEAAANGGDDDGLIENARLVEKGRELLGRRAQSTAP